MLFFMPGVLHSLCCIGCSCHFVPSLAVSFVLVLTLYGRTAVHLRTRSSWCALWTRSNWCALLLCWWRRSRCSFPLQGYHLLYRDNLACSWTQSRSNTHHLPLIKSCFELCVSLSSFFASSSPLRQLFFGARQLTWPERIDSSVFAVLKSDSAFFNLRLISSDLSRVSTRLAWSLPRSHCILHNGVFLLELWLQLGLKLCPLFTSLQLWKLMFTLVANCCPKKECCLSEVSELLVWTCCWGTGVVNFSGFTLVQ